MKMEKMENPVYLKDYLAYHHDQEKYQALFFGLSQELHKLYDQDKYLPLFTVRNATFLNQALGGIVVDGEDPSKVKIFKSYPISDYYKEFAKGMNIEFLASLMATVYISDATTGFDINRGLFNSSVLEQKFDDCTYSFPKEDTDYLREVILEKKYTFYDDYVKLRESRNSTSISQSRQYVKSNGLSMLDRDEDDKTQISSHSKKEAGYSRIIFLAATFTTTLLLLGFMIFSIVLS